MCHAGLYTYWFSFLLHADQTCVRHEGENKIKNSRAQSINEYVTATTCSILNEEKMVCFFLK